MRARCFFACDPLWAHEGILIFLRGAVWPQGDLLKQVRGPMCTHEGLLGMFRGLAEHFCCLAWPDEACFLKKAHEGLLNIFRGPERAREGLLIFFSSAQSGPTRAC